MLEVVIDKSSQKLAGSFVPELVLAEIYQQYFTYMPESSLNWKFILLAIG